MLRLILIVTSIVCPVASFAFVGSATSKCEHRSLTSQLCMLHNNLDRRSLLSILPTAAAAATFSSPAIAADKPKVVVVGGAGWVGAHVDQLLLDKGCQVVSVSRSSPSVQAEKIKAILGSSLSSIDYQSLDASTDDLSEVFRGASAVISCVGALPGSSNQRAGNGAVNVRIADAAKAAGVDKFVYISVASDLANGPAKFLIGEYFKGKKEAETAVIKDYGDSALIIKPGVIAGGPPGEIRPPGPPGMTPVSAEAVAKAAVAGALGNLKGTVDGNGAIVTAATA